MPPPVPGVPMFRSCRMSGCGVSPRAVRCGPEQTTFFFPLGGPARGKGIRDEAGRRLGSFPGGSGWDLQISKTPRQLRQRESERETEQGMESVMHLLTAGSGQFNDQFPFSACGPLSWTR